MHNFRVSSLRFCTIFILLLVSFNSFSQYGCPKGLSTPGTMKWEPDLGERLKKHKFILQGDACLTDGYYIKKGSKYFEGGKDTITVDNVYEAYDENWKLRKWVQFTKINGKPIVYPEFKDKMVVGFIILENLEDAENRGEASVTGQLKKEALINSVYGMVENITLIIGCFVIISLCLFLRRLYLKGTQQCIDKLGIVNGLRIQMAFPFEYREHRMFVSGYSGTVSGNTVNMNTDYSDSVTLKRGWVVRCTNVSKRVIESIILSARKEERDSYGVIDSNAPLKSSVASFLRPHESRNIIFLDNGGTLQKTLVVKRLLVKGKDEAAIEKDINITIPYFVLKAWPFALLMSYFTFKAIEGTRILDFFTGGVGIFAAIVCLMGLVARKTPVWLMMLSMACVLFTKANFAILFGALYLGIVYIKRTGGRDFFRTKETYGGQHPSLTTFQE